MISFISKLMIPILYASIAKKIVYFKFLFFERQKALAIRLLSQFDMVK